MEDTLVGIDKLIQWFSQWGYPYWVVKRSHGDQNRLLQYSGFSEDLESPDAQAAAAELREKLMLLEPGRYYIQTGRTRQQANGMAQSWYRHLGDRYGVGQISTAVPAPEPIPDEVMYDQLHARYAAEASLREKCADLRMEIMNRDFQIQLLKDELARTKRDAEEGSGVSEKWLPVISGLMERWIPQAGPSQPQYRAQAAGIGSAEPTAEERIAAALEKVYTVDKDMVSNLERLAVLASTNTELYHQLIGMLQGMIPNA